MIIRPKPEDFYDEEKGEYVWPMYELRLHPYAKTDRADILAYSRDHFGARTAAGLYDRLEDLFHQIRNTPFVGRDGRVEGTYELSLGRYPFWLVHAPRPPFSAVLRILHKRRQWPERQLIKLANAKKLKLLVYP